MSSGFVSEADLAERRRVKKEIWQNNRRDSDPEEPPEEPVHDPRTLFEKLQEQKDKKQEEWEEAHKLKNMVRGLEDDEVDFLELVDNTKLLEEKRIKAEEYSALKEYRKKVSEMQQKAVEAEILSELKPDSRRSSTGAMKKTSQISLLAGAIKRKRSETDQEEDEDDSKNSKPKVTDDNTRTTSEQTSNHTNPGIRCVAVLPGLGVYTDSSDSENDSNSDSDLENTSKFVRRDLTGRIIHYQTASGGKGC